jgi:hypothetical protein
MIGSDDISAIGDCPETLWPPYGYMGEHSSDGGTLQSSKDDDLVNENRELKRKILELEMNNQHQQQLIMHQRF